jgi:hypothetical protein
MFKASLMKKAYSKWRAVAYGQVKGEMLEKQEKLERTKVE